VDRFSSLFKLLCGCGLCSGWWFAGTFGQTMAPPAPQIFFDCTLADYPLNDDALFSFMRLKDEFFSEFSPVASRTTETAFASG
jgi:hypothetical protein